VKFFRANGVFYGKTRNCKVQLTSAFAKYQTCLKKYREANANVIRAMTKKKKFYKIDTRNGLIGAVRTLLNQSVGGFKVQTLDLLNLPQSISALPIDRYN
jgi:hypothetical protein